MRDLLGCSIDVAWIKLVPTAGGMELVGEATSPGCYSFWEVVAERWW